MDKNTIWAIVLSTIVIIGAWFVMPLVMNKKAPAAETAVEQTSTETSSAVETENEATEIAVESDETETDVISEAIEEAAETEPVEELKEEFIDFENDKVQVRFSTKGGDIVSYKLVGIEDRNAGDLIQISDNVSDKNRTLSLSLGAADDPIINEIFNYEKDESNPNVFFFTKKFNKNGNKFVIGKKYTFVPEEYMFKLDIMIHSDNGLDNDGAAYTLRTSPQIGPHFDAKQNRYDNRQFISYDGKKGKKVVLGNNQFKRYEKTCLWGGIAGKYFEELVVPQTTGIWNAVYYSSKVETNDYANAQAYFERKAVTEKDVTDTYYVYFGPRRDEDLKIYNVPENNKWGLGGNKLPESLYSSWLGWLENILKWCLVLLHKVIKNWGVCIIVLTILLRVLMFPLSLKQSMGTIKMQALQPKIQAVQNKYADDKQKQQEEMQKIYQEANYNPASGCLPMILQFLILFAMFYLFNNYYEFYGSMFIPKWIEDLSEGDTVYQLKFNIPLLGNQLRILPVIYVVSQILFSVITQNGGSTAGSDQNSMNMKFMTYGMPILFFFLFYNTPSGLLLYWITSNLIQLIQQVVINQMMKKKKAEIVVESKPKTKQETVRKNSKSKK